VEISRGARQASKHIHNISVNLETRRACGEAMRIIACVADPHVIEKILIRLYGKAPELKVARAGQRLAGK
jgi:hypothetical protein